MDKREVCWGLFLAGLPFAHFVLSPDRLNPWQAQTLWAQGWLAILVGWNLWQPSHQGSVANRPFGAWTAWTGLSVLGIWLTYLKRSQQHPIGLLPGLAHYLCVVFFYMAAVRAWRPSFVPRLFTWLAWSGFVCVVYGFLQLADLDQFYRSMDLSEQRHLLIGTMGNPSHFGTYLALILPIFLWQPRWQWKIVAGLTTLLICCTHSISAYICAAAVWVWWTWQEWRSRLWWMLSGFGAVAVGLALLDHRWLNPEGRFQVWALYWKYYLVGIGKLQLTGAGVGRVINDAKQNLPGLPKEWAQVHCEYFQVLIEQGVIGLSFVLWGLGDVCHRWWRLPRTPVSKTLAGIGISFLLSCLVSFPAHLWVLASLGLVAYCGIYALSATPEAC